MFQTDVRYGQVGYNLRADRNGDGIVTAHEEYLASLEAHNDYVNEPGNFGNQRRILFGVELAW